MSTIKKIQAGTITYDIEPANAAELDVTNKAPTLAWNTTSTIATVNGTDITVKMPANPDTKVTVDSSLSSTSTNPVQNKVINSALAGKASTAAATTAAAGLMSAADKTKLNGIATGAEVNVQSDWNATSGDAFIKNKPTILTIGTGASNAAAGNHTHNYASTAVATTTTAGLMSKDDKVKLNGIATGANKVTKAKATGNTTTVASNSHIHSVTASGSVSLTHTSTNSGKSGTGNTGAPSGTTATVTVITGSYTNGVLTLSTTTVASNSHVHAGPSHSHTYDKSTSASFSGTAVNSGTPSGTTATTTVPTSGHTHGLE